MYKRIVIGVCTVAVSRDVVAQDAYLLGLGFFPGDDGSGATAVSADGQTVVGASNFIGFKWTRESGMISLGDLPGGLRSSPATAVSPDGRHVVGYSGSDPGGYEAYLWTDPAEMVGAGRLPGAVNSSFTGVSAGGRVASGYSGPMGADRVSRAVRWTAETGLVDLGILPGGDPRSSSFAWGISADGGMIVGGAAAPGGQAAFRWTEGGGMKALPTIYKGGAFQYDAALGVSSDGQWVCGHSVSTDGTGVIAALWTPDDTVVNLGVIQAGTPSRAWGVSDGGTMVIGESGGHPFIWTPDAGMRRAEDALLDYGLDVASLGWELNIINGLSPDGQWLVGQGINPVGDYEAVLIHLPAPGAVGLLLAWPLLTPRKRPRS